MSTVTRPERSRLLEAMLEELVEKGYRDVEVQAAARRAHLVGEDWADRFQDKDACLVAAFEELADQLLEAIGRGCVGATSWTEQVAGGLRGLIGELSSRATMAEALARTFPSIGTEAITRYQAFVESLGPLLAPGREQSEAGAALPAEVELLAIGAAEAIVFEQIQLGRTAELGSLVPELLFSLLVPFLGPASAAAAMERESQRPNPRR